MDNSLILSKNSFSSEFINSGQDKKISKTAPSFADRVFLNLTDNKAEDLFSYLKIVGLPADSNIVILAPGQHYYYDESDLRNVRILINLKRLNQIKEIDRYLHNLYRILPMNASFVGCFYDSSLQKRHRNSGKYSRTLISRMLNLFNTPHEQELTRHKVTELLWKHNFETVDMTDINGLTYFYSRNIEKPFEIRA